MDASGWSIAGVGECTFRPGTKIALGAVVVCKVEDLTTYDPTIPGASDAVDTGKSLQRPKGASKWSVAAASPGRS